MAKNRRKKSTFEDVIKLRGQLEYELRDARSGEIIQKGKSPNVVTFWGRSYVIDRIVSNVETDLIKRIALGTDATATNATQTVLAGYFSIASITLAKTTANNAAPYFRATVSWASDGTHASSSSISEFALYNSTDTGGVMFNRVTTGTPINFGSTNTLAVTLTVSN